MAKIINVALEGEARNFAMPDGYAIFWILKEHRIYNLVGCFG